MSERMEQVGKRLLLQLVSQGCEAYWVGGCVRDKLLGRPLKDIDIATSAKPEDVMRFFPHSIPTGLQHGTVTVVEEGIPYEVTTFRRETEYEQHRRPIEVEYISDLNEDLQRRDFTMNAIAMDASGAILDPFKGQADMKLGILRCVGEASTRFEEDALRMLRCIRFACEYSMTIELATWQALLVNAPLLRHIAMERVQAELDKIIGGAGPDLGIRLLAESGLLAYTKDKLDWPIANTSGRSAGNDNQQYYDGIHPSEQWAGHLAELDATDLRWAYWMLQMGVTAEEAREGFSRLRFSASKSAAITSLLRVQEWMEAKLGEAGAGSESEAEAELGEAGARSESEAEAELGEAGARSESEAEAELGEAVAQQRSSESADALLREALARASVRCGADAVRGWLRLLAPGAAAPARSTAQPAPARRAPSAAQRHRLLQSGTDWLQAMPASRVSELALTGRDVLAALARPAGPWLGQLLDGLLLEVALGRLPNDKGRLIQAARQQIVSEANE